MKHKLQKKRDRVQNMQKALKFDLFRLRYQQVHAIDTAHKFYKID